MSAAGDWDVVCVGAGPAGALAACLLARAGRSVLLLDRAAWPRRKVCGCVLNGNAAATLAAVGLAGVLAGAVRGERFVLAARGRTASIRLRESRILSRPTLDGRIVEAAVAAGATFQPETTARLEPAGPSDAMRTLDIGRPIRAKVVVAADGLAGGLLGGEPASATGDSRLGAGVVVAAPASDYPAGTVAMGVAAGGYVGLTRLEDGRLNVAAAFDPRRVTEAGGLGPCAEAVLRDAGLPPVDGLAAAAWKGTPRLTRQPERPAAVRAFAVGDAAGYVEPFTGEGMAWALAAARTVVPFALAAVERWDARLIDDWTHAQRRAVGRKSLCRLLAWGLRRPRLVAAAVALGCVAPAVFVPAVRLLDRPATSPA